MSSDATPEISVQPSQQKSPRTIEKEIEKGDVTNYEYFI